MHPPWLGYAKTFSAIETFLVASDTELWNRPHLSVAAKSTDSSPPRFAMSRGLSGRAFAFRTLRFQEVNRESTCKPSSLRPNEGRPQTFSVDHRRAIPHSG